VAVTGSEGDAAQGRERGCDVGRGDGLKIFAGLNAKAHQQDGNVLVVVVRGAVTRSEGARTTRRGPVQQPVRLRHDEEVAATSGEITEGHGAERGALRGGPILQFFCAVYGGDTGLRQNGLDDSLHRRMVVEQLVVDAGSKVNVAAIDGRNGWFRVIEGSESLFDLGL